MASRKHIAILKQGVKTWNKWRRQTSLIPNLNGADLANLDLRGVDFSNAYINGVNFNSSNLCDANFRGAWLNGTEFTAAGLVSANLSNAVLIGANLDLAHLISADLRRATLDLASLVSADLRRANLSEASLCRTDLTDANLRNATLDRANLQSAVLVETNLKRASLNGCRVYGIAAWRVSLEGALQSNLIITRDKEPIIQLDRLEVAQFIYLLLNNREVRYVIDTITSKVVLILGRFSPQRKPLLDALRYELRRCNYLPILFDFEKPSSRDLTETISTLAHLARFIIADITDAKSIPQELQRIVPSLPSVPVQPLLFASQHQYGMFEHFQRYPWVLKPVIYDDQQELLTEIQRKVIAPAESKAREQIGR